MMRRHFRYAFVVWALTSFVATAQAQSADGFVKDEDVTLKTFVEMAYPPYARSARLQGAVVVRVTLDEHGAVETATSLSGSAVLAPDAVANAKKWTFVPSAKRVVVLLYLFDIDGACQGLKSLFRIVRVPNVAKITTCSEWIPPN